MNLKSFEELKLSGNLPSPAGVGMRILQLTRTEDYSAEEMGVAIMADSALTGRILKLANSASNTGAEPATTVSGAIMRLGGRTVRDLALAFSLVSDRSAGTCRGFDYEGYWTVGLARAVSAQVISRVTSVAKPEEAYICGLLGEIGRLALASVYARQYSKILGTSADVAEHLAVEEAEFNITHAQVGFCMTNDWGLPETFSEAIEQFCGARRIEADEEITSLASILRHADVVSRLLTQDEDAQPSTWRKLGEDLEVVREHLGHSPEAFSHFIDACISEWQAWGNSLDIDTPEDLKYRHLAKQIEDAEHAVDDPAVALSQTNAVNMAPMIQEPIGDMKFKVLAVDDDPVSLKILSSHLTKEGYEVITCRGGKSALRLALSETPDIVIADWQMPDMDGIELCRELRKTDAGRGMFFLLLTGIQDEDLIVEAFDGGADDFVTKPFIPRLLTARIKGGVRLAELRRKIEDDKQTMMKQVAELGVLTRKLRAASLTDVLTELPNRRFCMKRLDSEWASTERTKRALSVVMLDIDKFKLVNDTHGHDAGDEVLKHAARMLQEHTRASDVVCRLGGEEFLIIAKNTDEEECKVVAERVRVAMESNSIHHEGVDHCVTVSLGIASTNMGYESVHELLKAADEAVYEAKDGGRNQYRMACHKGSKKKTA